MFFGGEPLLNLPVMYRPGRAALAARPGRAASDIASASSPTACCSPGDRRSHAAVRAARREDHARRRPRHAQPDAAAARRPGHLRSHHREHPARSPAGCAVAIGGNFDESSVDSYPALLEFLREQDFADKLVKVNFKPIVRSPEPSVAPPRRASCRSSRSARRRAGKPLGGTCMTSVGEGWHRVGLRLVQLRRRQDVVPARRDSGADSRRPTACTTGPCHVHIEHAHTIGPDGSLYACPGFTGEKGLSTGHIDDRREAWRETAREKFDRLHPWKECGDCAFIPVCAGGCVVASHTQLGDMNTPTCHKRSFESALISLAHDVASAA